MANCCDASRPANRASRLVERSLAVVLVVSAFSNLIAQTTTGGLKAGISSGTAVSIELRKAVAAAKSGDGKQALELTRALIARHPGYAPAYKFQGLVLEQAGDVRGAAASYEQALALAPADAELLLKVGTLRLVAGDKDGAIDLFTRRLKLVPRDGDTLYYLAQAYHLKGEDDLALKTIARCVKVQPDNVAVWQKYGELLVSSGDDKAALGWLAKAQTADPTLERIDFDIAVASFHDQDLASAAQHAAKAVELQPGDRKALALLSEVYIKLGQWQDAKPVFERILALDSNDAPARLGLGHCDLLLKDYPAAIDNLQLVLRRDPTQVLAHFYLSRAYAAVGRTEDAAREADLHGKLLEQSASTATGSARELEKATLKQARDLLTANRETDALQLFRERAKGPTATPGAPYMLVGMVYLSMGNQEDARRALNRSLAIDPAVRGAHTYLGILALENADLEQAETEFKAELADEPNFQLAVAEMGEVRYRQKRYEEASDYISRSRTVVPSLLYLLCDSYFKLGKVREANLTAELIVDYAPTDPGLRKRVVDLLSNNQQTELAARLTSR